MKRYLYNFDLEMSITLAAIILMIIATLGGMQHIPGGF
jgi:Na+(H+)/acetate symporter ActP